MKNKIVVTGGGGRFAQSLKKTKSKYIFIYPNKTRLNILNIKSIERYLKKIKPKSVLHLAGLSRPMSIHEKDLSKSISLNIIGTSNFGIFSYIYTEVTCYRCTSTVAKYHCFFSL